MRTLTLRPRTSHVHVEYGLQGHTLHTYFAFIPQPADDMELQEANNIRMSPILSLRNKAANYNTTGYEETLHMRSMAAAAGGNMPRVAYPAVRGGQAQVLRRRTNSTNFQKRRRVITSIKRKAKEFRQKIPSVKDVNKIDKYSRLVFPSLFIVFNMCYWCFYLLQ